MTSDRQGFDGRTDLFLFFPPTVKMSACSKQELMLDFNSRIRLSLPSRDRHASSLRRVYEECEEILQKFAIKNAALLDAGPSGIEAMVEAIQKVGATTNELLKSHQAHQRQRIFLAHSLAGTDENGGLKALSREIEETAGYLVALQDLLRSEEARDLPYLALLAEYVGHLYVQYLGDLTTSLEPFVQNGTRVYSEDLADGRVFLERLLKRLTREAASTLAENEEEWWRDEKKRELHLVRVGQLKKFFHANLFVEVSKKQVMKRFQEPAAAAAAAFAALWAAYFQQFQQPQMMSVGLSGVSIISLGVAAYVLKDRLKDGAKNFLAKKASQYLPDLEQDLSTGERSVGRVREWLNMAKFSRLPAEVAALRNAHRVSAAESHLQEEVLHHARQYSVKAEAVSAGASGWGVQESLRVNLERYLKHLDDPYKDLTVLGHGGNMEKMRAHRVYHFFLIVKTQRTSSRTPGGFWAAKKTTAPGMLEAFRLVMDKNGIQRVESLGRVPAVAVQPVARPRPLPLANLVPALQWS